MRATKEIENAGATPEQLLQIIEAELASHCSHRGGANRNRAIILVVGILFIVMAAGGALLVLEQMLTDLQRNGPSQAEQSSLTPQNL